jgi:hypothetical protein
MGLLQEVQRHAVRSDMGVNRRLVSLAIGAVARCLLFATATNLIRKANTRPTEVERHETAANDHNPSYLPRISFMISSVPPIGPG